MNQTETIILSAGAILSSLIAIPYLRTYFDQEFQDGQAYTWVRILFLVFPLCLGSVQALTLKWTSKKLQYALLVLYSTVLVGSFYFIVFGILFASLELNYSQEDLVMDNSDVECAQLDTFEDYQTVLFITCYFGLVCFSVSFSQTHGLNRYVRIFRGEVSVAPKNESGLNESSMDNSRSGMIGKKVDSKQNSPPREEPRLRSQQTRKEEPQKKEEPQAFGSLRTESFTRGRGRGKRGRGRGSIQQVRVNGSSGQKKGIGSFFGLLF